MRDRVQYIKSKVLKERQYHLPPRIPLGSIYPSLWSIGEPCESLSCIQSPSLRKWCIYLSVSFLVLSVTRALEPVNYIPNAISARGIEQIQEEVELTSEAIGVVEFWGSEEDKVAITESTDFNLSRWRNFLVFDKR